MSKFKFELQNVLEIRNFEQQQAESENRLMIVAKIAGNSRFLFIT